MVQTCGHSLTSGDSMLQDCAMTSNGKLQEASTRNLVHERIPILHRHILIPAAMNHQHRVGDVSKAVVNCIAGSKFVQMGVDPRADLMRPEPVAWPAGELQI